MARRIYIVELEVEAAGEPDMPTPTTLLQIVLVAARKETARFAYPYEVVAGKPVGIRDE